MKLLSRHNYKILVIFLLVLLFYMAFYWPPPRQDILIDFIPLCVVGKMFLENQWNCFYDYKVTEHKEGFVIRTGDCFQDFTHRFQYISPHKATPLYIYAPSFIPAFASFAVLPFSIVKYIVIILNSFAVVFLIFTLIRSNFENSTRTVMFLFISLLLLWGEPTQWCIQVGQITPWLFLLTFFAWKWGEEKHPIFAGFMLALTFWMKFFPALLILYWLRHSKFKALASFGIILVAQWLFGIAIFGMQTFNNYLNVLQVMGLGTPIFPVNQSIESALMRWLLPIQVSVSVENFYLYPSVKIASLVIKAFLLFLLVLILLKKAEGTGKKSLQAFCTMALSTLLLPISWSHYVIFALPLSIFLIKEFWQQRKEGKIYWILAGCLLFVLSLQFLSMSSVRYISNTSIALIGKNASEPLVKLLLDRQLFGTLIIYCVGIFRFFTSKTERK